MNAVASVHAIRWINHVGGEDAFYEINLISPYPTVVDRDADMARLAALPGMYRSVEFLPSRTDRVGAGEVTDPLVVRDVTDLDSFVAAISGQ